MAGRPFDKLRVSGFGKLRVSGLSKLGVFGASKLRLSRFRVTSD